MSHIKACLYHLGSLNGKSLKAQCIGNGRFTSWALFDDKIDTMCNVTFHKIDSLNQHIAIVFSLHLSLYSDKRYSAYNLFNNFNEIIPIFKSKTKTTSVLTSVFYPKPKPLINAVSSHFSQKHSSNQRKYDLPYQISEWSLSPFPQNKNVLQLK